MGHDHHHTDPGPSSAGLRLALAAILVPIAVVTVAAMALMWPHDRTASLTDPDALARTENLDASVVRIDEQACGGDACTTVRVRLLEGPDAGTEIDLERMQRPGTPGAPALHVGKDIVVSRVDLVADGSVTYNYVGPARRTPLALLAGAFVVAVVAVARWRGVAALVGLGVTYAVLVGFVIPAIINGAHPVPVALTGSMAAMFVVLYLAHGFNVRTSTALVGTLASLGVIGALAWLFVRLADLTGMASEEVMFIQAAGANLNLRGLLLAGMIIGSMGVLNDVTVTQASAVWEVRRADPSCSVRALYGAGMRIGRDHIASVVDTLVLAYAGASLPLMILFVIGNQQLGDVLTGEVVAEEVVRTLVGSIGLVASVPLTTAVAAVVASRQPAAATAPVPGQETSAGDEARRVVPIAEDPITVGPDGDQWPRQAVDWLEQRRRGAAVRTEERARRRQAERSFWGDDA